ncbi:MAG: alpha-2-macroglobulin family protein [Polyangia bacterium]
MASACLALAPFIVRPALPRMLRPNDAAEVAAIVQNQTEWNGRLLVEASIGDTSGEPANTIQLRATTPGRYVLPPARAEAMYTPEVYGRSAGGQLVVR